MKKRKEDSPCQERQPKGCCTHDYAYQQGEEEDYEKYGKGVT